MFSVFHDFSDPCFLRKRIQFQELFRIVKIEEKCNTFEYHRKRLKLSTARISRPDNLSRKII